MVWHDMSILKSMADFLKRFWWLLIEIMISIIIAWYGPSMLTPFIRIDVNLEVLMLRISSDALTLMGFTITSLAVIARNIDRPIFDEIREETSFKDLWYTFGLTASMLGILAILIHISYVFVTPSWLFQMLGFLLVINIFLVLDCIVFLVTIVSFVNQDRIDEVSKREPAKPEFPDNS